MRTFPADDERDDLLDTWQEAAPGWGRQADGVREAAMAVSEWMLDHAQLQPGQTVLELAAGPGDTGFLAAQRVKPGGRLLSSDAVAAMLEVAKERAAEQGVDNVEFKRLQIEWIDVPTASFDAVLIKWALMLVVDPSAALRECRRVLKPGGMLSLAVWDLAEHNPWVTIPQQAMVELGHLQPSEPGALGMFALASPPQLQELLEDAPFFDLIVEPIPFERMYANINAWIGETIDLSGSFKAAWVELSDEERRAVRTRVAELSAAYADAQGALVLPARSLGAAASA